MRLKLLGLLFFWGLATFLPGQGLLDQRIDFKVDERSIPEALNLLSQQSGIDIAYSRRIFSPDKKISLDLKHHRVDDVLQKILADCEVGVELSAERVLISRLKKDLHVFSGFVVDSYSREALVSAAIYFPKLKTGVLSNEYGFFSLEVPPGKWDFEVRSLGYAPRSLSLEIDRDRQFRIGLISSLVLPEVTISPEDKEGSLSAFDKGRGVGLGTALIRDAPSLGGVEDPVRSAQLLPGIQGGVEGAAGLFVRGGDSGHNLMLLDGAPVFIPFHLLGVYSVYNSSTVKSLNVIKGDFSARYGGRLTSIFDVRTREGNLNRWQGQAQANLTLAEASIEGPIKKEKGSILVAGRWMPRALMLGPVLDRYYFSGPTGELESRFFDLNLKANYQLGPKDRLYASFFTGKDEFAKEFEQVSLNETEDSETEIEWQNTAFSLRWNHLFSQRLFSNTRLTYSRFHYQYSSYDRFIPSDTSLRQSLFFLDSRSDNQHLGLSSDFDWFPHEKHQVRLGAGLSLPIFQPAFQYFDQDSDALTDLDSLDRNELESLVESENHQIFQAFVYGEDKILLAPNWKLRLGLRGSFFCEENEVFFYPEPRIGLTWQAQPKISLFVNANRMVQYLHLIPNTAMRFPNDLWLSSSEYLPPQTSISTELGAQLSPFPGMEASAVLYSNFLQNLYALPDSLGFLQNQQLQSPADFLLRGQGQAYGLELTGTYRRERHFLLISYALSHTERQFDSLNRGNPFPHAFDRRHQFSLFASEKVGQRLRLGLNWVYQSGNPRLGLSTVESGLGFADAGIHPPGQLNLSRSRAYHRLDLNATYLFGTGPLLHRIKIGVYNLYNRKNVAYYDRQNGNLREITAIPFQPSFQYSLRF